MCCHPAGGLVSGTLVNALLYHLGREAITDHSDDGASERERSQGVVRPGRVCCDHMPTPVTTECPCRPRPSVGSIHVRSDGRGEGPDSTHTHSQSVRRALDPADLPSAGVRCIRPTRGHSGHIHRSRCHRQAAASSCAGWREGQTSSNALPYTEGIPSCRCIARRISVGNGSHSPDSGDYEAPRACHHSSPTPSQVHSSFRDHPLVGDDVYGGGGGRRNWQRKQPQARSRRSSCGFRGTLTARSLTGEQSSDIPPHGTGFRFDSTSGSPRDYPRVHSPSYLRAPLIHHTVPRGHGTGSQLLRATGGSLMMSLVSELE